MNDENGRSARLRHIATGAVAALAAVGAIAGAGALAATQHARPHRHHATRHTTPVNGKGGTRPGEGN